MIPLMSLWLPILLAAVLVFVASSFIHMVIKWHNPDYRALPNEDEVADAIRKGNPAPGQYVFPHCPDSAAMKSEAMQRKYRQGPLALLYLRPGGTIAMGKFLGSWFLFNVVVAFFVAYIVSRALPPGTPYLKVFRTAGSVAFLAHAAGAAPPSIWMGKPWRVTLKEMVDGLVYGLLTAGAFGWLWPR